MTDPQVIMTRAGMTGWQKVLKNHAPDLNGRLGSVNNHTALARIAALGWTILVEQPQPVGEAEQRWFRLLLRHIDETSTVFDEWTIVRFHSGERHFCFSNPIDAVTMRLLIGM